MSQYTLSGDWKKEKKYTLKLGRGGGGANYVTRQAIFMLSNNFF